jgi:hypothetical protein
MGSSIAVSIPDHLFSSRPYRALAPLERCLLIELLAVAKRVGTDAPIRFSVQQAGDVCGVSRRHGARAMSSLETTGFLVRIERGEKHQRRGFSSSWRITCLPFQGEPPTCDYNRIFDRAHNRKVADSRKGETKFFTPEMDAESVPPAARFRLQSVPPAAQVSNVDLLIFPSTKSIGSSEVCHRWPYKGEKPSFPHDLPSEFSASVRKGHSGVRCEASAHFLLAAGARPTVKRLRSQKT